MVVGETTKLGNTIILELTCWPVGYTLKNNHEATSAVGDLSVPLFWTGDYQLRRSQN